MKLSGKIFIVVLSTLIFFISGGIACTYGATNAINLALVGILGTLIFVGAGFAACMYGQSRIAKQKTNQTVAESRQQMGSE